MGTAAGDFSTGELGGRIGRPRFSALIARTSDYLNDIEDRKIRDWQAFKRWQGRTAIVSLDYLDQSRADDEGKVPRLKHLLRQAGVVTPDGLLGLVIMIPSGARPDQTRDLETTALVLGGHSEHGRRGPKAVIQAPEPIILPSLSGRPDEVFHTGLQAAAHTVEKAALAWHDGPSDIAPHLGIAVLTAGQAYPAQLETDGAILLHHLGEQPGDYHWQAFQNVR